MILPGLGARPGRWLALASWVLVPPSCASPSPPAVPSPAAPGGSGSEIGADPPPEPSPEHTGERPPHHEPVADDRLCWDCHGDDRPEGHYTHPDGEHYWDCGPCHILTAWADPATIEHPVRTPHGTSSGGLPTPTGEWIVACVPCHPTPGEYASFRCGACHLERDSGFFPHKTLLAPGEEADATCLGCHPAGDRIAISL